MSTEGFDSEISEDLSLKYDAKSSVVSDLIGGTVASVVDFGATVFNSLVPEEREVGTRDLINRVDSNAARIYDEHTDAVQAASFIGGIFAPTGLAMKGMSALRNGSKATNWFTTAGKVESEANIAKLFAKGPEATEQFRGAVNSMRAATWGNAAVDSIAAEVAIVGAMNAHPFMEDYMKDPATNFAKSALLGTGIMGGVGHIIDKGIVRGIKSEVEMGAQAIAREGYTYTDNVFGISDQLLTKQNNVRNWEGMLSSTKTADGMGPVRDLNDYTKDLISSLLMKEKASMVEVFDEAASPAIKALDANAKANLINLLAESRFQNIDSVSYVMAKEDLPTVMGKVKGMVESTILKPLGIETEKGIQTTLAKEYDIPLVQANKKGVDKGVAMVYSKEFDSFMLLSDYKHFGTAVDFVENEKALLTGVENNWHMLPRYDNVLENTRRTTAAVDADYLRSLKYYDELDIKKFGTGEISVAPDDISALQGIYARYAKEMQANPGIEFKVKLTKEMPKFDEASQTIIERVITNTITKTIKNGGSTSVNAGISKNALQEMTQMLRGSKQLETDLMEATNSLSYEARELARSFSTDQMWPLRQGIDIERRLAAKGGGVPQRNLSEYQARLWGSDNIKQALKEGMPFKEAMEKFGGEYSNLGKYAAEILNSKETRLLKQKLSQHADSEGYIYLYRGMRGKAAGHSAGESYTPDYRVAFNFAGQRAENVSLYKVHLDEVIGHLGQFGAAKGGEAEIVLDVPTRIVAGKMQPITGTQASGHSVTEVMTGQDIKEVVKKVAGKEEKLAGASEVFENLIKQKETSIMEYLQQGVPFETIALHTNVPVGTVKAFAATGQADLLASGATMRYSSAAEIGKYLSPENKALRVQSNVDKAPFARVKANLHSASMDTADAEIRTVMLNNSRSGIARSLGEFLGSDDSRYLKSVLTSGLEQIVNSKVGNKFLTSSDFALRHLEEYGSIISSMGKDVQHQINKQFKALWEPMETSFRTISKDPAATVELNTAINMNAGLKGYREFRDGKFFVQNAETPWRDIKDATGKVVGKERNMEEALFNGAAFEVKTAAVVEAMKEMQRAGRELYHLKTTMNQMVGRQAISDIGFWVPPFNPRARHVGYVFDKVEDKTMLLHGRTYEELMAAKNAHMETLNPADIGRRYEYIDDKVDQALFNKLQGRHDPVFMGAADSNMLHSGASRTAITNTNADILSDLANGYENYIGYGVRSIVDANSRNILNHFDNISYMVQKPMKDQPLNIVQKFMQAPLDGGKVLRNTYMGVSDLKDSGAWQSVSNLTNLGFEYAIKTISSVMEPVLNQGGKLFGKGKSASDADYTQLMKSLEDRGIVNPFQGMSDYTARNMYHVQRMSESPNMTPRILALSNSLASTLMLRVGELAQPYVNAISLPILTSGAMTRKLASSYMGTAVDPNAKFGVVATMYNGIRYGGSMEGQKFIKMGEEMGLFKPIISEATEVLSAANQLKPGAISAIEKGLQSKVVETLSWGADKSEAVVRRMAFQTGVYMAKEAYPGLKDAGIMTFARNFMDQTIGNYHAAQRPTMFQGTLGMAAGLFQTYMLTMAQQIYRNIESKEFKALAKMMLAQSSIFGARSLPGFNIVSEYIGEHFSDQHIDLSTGLYRALPDKMANIVLYGLPSNLGPAITTRGEIQPRIPNLLGEGVKAIPAINMLGQAYTAMDRVAGAAFTADANTGRAVMEAISMQSISRPIARVSELFTGHGLTQQGNVMYDVKTRNEDGEFEYRAILSRLAATRPLEEVKAREAYHLDSVYEASDKKQKQAVTNKLRIMLRDGDIDDEKLAKLAEEYMRSGTATGWRSVINKAIAQTSQPASNSVRNYLSSGSALQVMIDDLE